MAGTSAGNVLRASIAPFLLLVTPFAIFVRHNHHGFLHADVQLCVLALAGIALLLGAGAARWHAFEVPVLAALLVFFVDVQMDEAGEKRLVLAFVALSAILWLLREHAARIVSLAMGTILALSFIPLHSGASVAGAPADAPGAGELPLVLHLVLDEHIGVEGLPPELAASHEVGRALESFYVGRSFRVFGRAYSEHSNTAASLGHLLNLESGRYVSGLPTPSESGLTYRLTRSVYFNRLAGAGYRLRIYQSEHLDVCAAALRVAGCYTYQPSSLQGLESLDVPARQKVPVIAGAFLARSEIHERAKRTYTTVRHRLLEAGTLRLPRWDWERFAPASLGAMPVFDRVAGDLTRATRGEAYFAHLLMPHDPYVFTAGCEPRPPAEWVTRADASAAIVPGGVTTTQSREARYRLYLDHVLCTTRKVARLLEAIPPALRDDAIVIVQGDHGSRIGVNPATAPAGSLRAADYADSFSTLFAVRAPGTDAGYDVRPASITCLLRTLATNDFRSIGDVSGCAAPRLVYFSERPAERAPFEQPLPDFWSR